MSSTLGAAARYQGGTVPAKSVRGTEGKGGEQGGRSQEGHILVSKEKEGESCFVNWK